MSSVEFIAKKRYHLIEPIDIAREKISVVWEDIKLWSFFATVFGLLFPPLLLGVGIALLLYFLDKIYSKYFGDPEVRAFYEREFKPKITQTQYLQVGYEIYPSELNQHLKLVNNLLESGKEEEEAIKALSRKATLYRQREPWRIVGYSKKTLPTHKWIVGTTGAGKTSYIMQGLFKQFEQGGGTIFIDGKGDTKGVFKFVKLAEKAGRLGDVQILNFLTSDQYRSHTNTYNPFLIFPPAQLVEFLDSLIPAQGEQEYWKGRGVSLMSCLVFGFAFRRKYWNEPFSYETLKNFRQVKPFTMLSAVIISLAILENEILRFDSRVNYIVTKARKILQPQTDIPYLELVVNYLKQNPTVREELEKLGYNTEYLEDLWETTSYFLTWVPSISDDWKEAVFWISRELVKDFWLGLKKFSLSDFLEAYRKKENELATEHKKNPYVVWITNPQSANEDALQQHLYAVQQWDKPFRIFQQYSHIFGALQSDIDFEDVIRNNKLLYVVLPALKQSEDTTKFLGRLILMSIRLASAKALGGAVELTRRQAELLTARITPVPPALHIYDEYGSFAVEGISDILAQVRSINISTWISTQDFTSGRTEGETAERAVLRMWANTNIKVLMKNLDKEIINIVKEYLPRQKVVQYSLYENEDATFQDVSITLAEEEILSPQKLEYFKNGLAFIFGEGRFCIAQIEYADTKPVEKFKLVRLEPLPF
jgi:hypothetical protein